jgi:FtsP/CotA-like multicopper oxidase with cupredoxin domain
MRRVLKWLAIAAGATIVALGAAAFLLYRGADVSTVGELGFANELKIPPVLEPRTDPEGRRVFDIELQEGESELLTGKSTQTWGANGAYLAPTLRASTGDDVLINVHNGLRQETTTIHWHGMHLPAGADGGPHQRISPGTIWSPGWTIDQPAATLWYHPHPHEATEEHVYRGITGMFLVDQPRGVPRGLPHRYGTDDIPVIIQDRRFNDDGSLDFSQSIISPTGILGDEILVNGTHDPFLEVSDARVRLRLLNASNSRVYDIGFSDDRAFDLVATDGGLLAAPEQLERLQLSPGERAEIVAAFEPGEEVILRSFEPDLGTNFWDGRFSGADDSFDLLEIRARESLRESPVLPEQLTRLDAPQPASATGTREFELTGGSSINGESMELARIDEVVEPGATEIWEVENASGIPHNFHIHGVQFRVLEYAGDPPPAELRGWKDTVYVQPNEGVRMITRFPGYVDPGLPFMFHCHVLEHEDGGMMGQYVVAERGQRPALEAHDHEQ